MKKIETLLWSMLLTVFSTQTVFADSFTSADEAAFIFAKAVALVIFVKLLLSITGSGLERFKEMRDGRAGGLSGSDRALKREQRRARRDRRSKVYGGYDSDGVSAGLGEKAIEAVAELGYGVARAGSWVGNQIAKPFKWFKNRAGMAKDLVVAAEAPTVSNIAKAGGTLAKGIDNERKIITGKDEASKRKSESLKAKQERATEEAKARARENRR